MSILRLAFSKIKFPQTNIIANFWGQLTKPLDNSLDDETNRRIRLLNVILVILIPLIPIIILIQYILLPEDLINTGISLLLTLGVLTGAYFLNRKGHHRLAVNLNFTMTLIVIVFAASNPDISNFTINYLLMIPFLASVIGNFRETIFWGVIAVATLCGFVVVTSIGDRAFTDYFIFSVILLSFISISMYYRNQLEREQQRIKIDHERLAIWKQLLDNVTHDLKTPLTIINNSTYLARRVKDEDKRMKQLNMIEAQSKRLESLIQGMLMMSRLDTVKEENKKWININDIAKESIQQFASLIESHHVNVHFQLANEIPSFYGNLESFRKVMLNLLENAIFYTPENGHITVSTQVYQGNMILKICDTGIGIHEDDLPLIFDRFYRADKARSTHSGGTGLGLAIVKKIVEAHNGQINVQSEMGLGTELSITLPFKK